MSQSRCIPENYKALRQDAADGLVSFRTECDGIPSPRRVERTGPLQVTQTWYEQKKAAVSNVGVSTIEEERGVGKRQLLFHSHVWLFRFTQASVSAAETSRLWHFDSSGRCALGM